MIPVAVEMISAGTCVTMPSPTVSSVKVCSASDQLMPRCAMPMARPPMMLMRMMMTPLLRMVICCHKVRGLRSIALLLFPFLKT